MPESEKTAHYFFANPHNIPGDAESITEQINASVHQAFAEDYAIISAQQEVISRNPEYMRISQQSCHPLHGKAATHFTRKLPPITRQSCQRAPWPPRR